MDKEKSIPKTENQYHGNTTLLLLLICLSIELLKIYQSPNMFEQFFETISDMTRSLIIGLDSNNVLGQDSEHYNET